MAIRRLLPVLVLLAFAHAASAAASAQTVEPKDQAKKPERNLSFQEYSFNPATRVFTIKAEEGTGAGADFKKSGDVLYTIDLKHYTVKVNGLPVEFSEYEAELVNRQMALITQYVIESITWGDKQVEERIRRSASQKRPVPGK